MIMIMPAQRNIYSINKICHINSIVDYCYKKKTNKCDICNNDDDHDNDCNGFDKDTEKIWDHDKQYQN